MQDGELERWKRAQAKRWLSEVRESKLRAEVARRMADELREMADGVRAAGFEAGRACGIADRTADAVARVQEATDALCAETARFIGLEEEARRAIGSLSPRPGGLVVLEYRYLMAKSWDEVCELSHYSRDGAMHAHQRALLAAYEVMPHRFRDPLPPAL